MSGITAMGEAGTPDLDPPDFDRCQGESQVAWSPFNFGPRPGFVRCANLPEYMAKEKRLGSDAQIGSMSLCHECALALPFDLATLSPITPTHNLD